MSETISDSSSRKDTLIRFLYVILFALIYSVAEIVLAALVIVQFGFVLVLERENPRLKDFSAGLSKFIYQLLQFATFQTDHKPFPFSDWPAA